MSFCECLREIEVQCNRCLENGLGAFHINLGAQEYYPADFQVYDTIQVIRHDHRISIETDIEAKYQTKYQYGRFAGKGAEFTQEWNKKDKAMRDYLQPKLPVGASILLSHQHYNPDKHDPEVVAMHIHVHKNVEDLDEAKVVVRKLVEAVQPKEIAKALKELK